MRVFVFLSTLMFTILLSACAPMTTPNPNQPAAQPSATPTLPPSGAVGEDFIGSEWRLTSFNGSAPVGSLPITLIFRNETELGGSGGCNGYFGAYTLAGETFTASGLGSTMMACGEEGVMEQESAYFQLLSEGGLLARTGDELTITNARGALKFERVVPPPPAALEGTLWRLEAFGSAEAVSSLLANTEITALFENGKVGGYSGCNWYGADYTLEGETITVGFAQQTVRACLPDEVLQQEQAFAEALRTSTRFTIQADRLTLTHPGGTLIFRAMPPLGNAGWKLVAWEDGTPLPTEVEITATFADDQVTGFGGCNNYFGEYALENGRLTVGAVGASKKFCEGVMDLEQRFFTSLQKPHNLVITENQLKLINDNGTLVFEAVK